MAVVQRYTSFGGSIISVTCVQCHIYISFILDLPIFRFTQLDARLTGDQEVAGSCPVGSTMFFLWRLIMKYFLRHSLPSANSRRAVVRFWRKNTHNTGLPLGGLSQPSKIMVR